MASSGTIPAPWIACTVIDDFLDHTGLHVMLAALRAVTSGLTERPLALDRYKPFIEAALVRVVSEALVGLDWVGTSTATDTVGLTLELRQIDPAAGASWAQTHRVAGNSPQARFLLAMYDGPLSVGDLSFLLGPSSVDPPACRVRARLNRAVFSTSHACVWVAPFGPPVAECSQDLFVLSGNFL